LSRLIRNKRVLIVLDNFWDVDYFTNFRRITTDSQSQLLITTRDVRDLSQLTLIKIEEFNDSEVNQLFFNVFEYYLHSLPVQDQHLVTEIVARCGHLPLSVSLIFRTKLTRKDGWQNIMDKIIEAKHLTSHLFAYEGNPTILQVIHASFLLLEEVDKELFDKMISFVIFQPNTNVPLKTLEVYWNNHGIGLEISNLVLCSLLNWSDYKQSMVHLHDEIMRYLKIQHQKNIGQLNHQLINMYKAKYHEWYKVDDVYIVKNLFYHLRAIEDISTMKDLLFDYRWLVEKLKKFDVFAILNDFNFMNKSSSDMRAIQQAIMDMKHLLHNQESWREFGGQLIARLTHEHGSDNIKTLLSQIKKYNKDLNIPWLLPIVSTFHSRQAPKNDGHKTAVNCLVVIDELDLALSGSIDGVIKKWDIKSSYKSIINETDFKPTTYTSFHDLPVHSIVCIKQCDIWYAISASSDRIVKWKIDTGEISKIVPMQISNLVLCSNNTVVVLSESDNNDNSILQLMDTSTLSLTLRIECDKVIRISSFSNYIITVSVANKIHLWNTKTLEWKTISPGSYFVTAVLLIEFQTASNYAILIGTSTGVIQLCNLNTITTLVNIYQAKSAITVLHFDSHNSIVFFGTKDGVVGKYSLSENKLLEDNKTCVEAITGLSLTKINDQHCMLIASKDTSVQLWTSFGIPSLFLLGGFRMRKGLISFYKNSIAVTRDFTLSESLERDRDVKAHLISVYNFQLTSSIVPERLTLLSEYTDPKPCPSGDFKDGGNLPLLMLPNGTSYLIPTIILTGYIDCLHIVSTNLLVFADYENSLITPFLLNDTYNSNMLWRSNMKKQLEERKSTISTTLATEKYIFLGLHNGNIECWELPSGPLSPIIAVQLVGRNDNSAIHKYTFSGHIGKVSFISVKDNYIASSSYDGTIILWSIEKQQLVKKIECGMDPGPLDILVEEDFIFIIYFLQRINSLVVQKFDTNDRKVSMKLQYLQTATIHSVKVLPKNKGFVTVDNRGVLDVWNYTTNNPICSFTTLAPLTDCSVNENGLIAVVDKLHQFNVFCLQSPSPSVKQNCTAKTHSSESLHL
jgi:WD40 repeat protein